MRFFNHALKVLSSYGGTYKASADLPDSWWKRHFNHGNPHTKNPEAMDLSPVFACQRGIAESIAMLPKDLIRKAGGKREEVTEHPSLDIFEVQANDLMTSHTFFEVLQNLAMGWGNGYAEIQFVEGTMQAAKLWPIPSDCVTPTPFVNKANQLDLTYEIRLPDGKKTYLPKERMFHLMGVTFDGIAGVSILKAACRAIGLGRQLEEFESKYFDQGILGGGFIEVPSGMEKQAVINLRQDLEEFNGGIDNAHRFHFLYDSVKFSAAGLKLEEAQFVSLYVKNIETIARFYRMPLHKIGAQGVGGGAAAYNSIELFEHGFVNDTLMPWGNRWAQEARRKLFTEPKDKSIRLKFNYNAILRGDSVARANYYRTMVMSGVMTRNEARSFEDMSPKDGADELIVPLNMTEIGSDKEAAARERVQD